MAGRTTLIIAHRLSTISSVDRIVTIKDGRIDEIGTPDELAATDGICRPRPPRRTASGSTSSTSWRELTNPTTTVMMILSTTSAPVSESQVVGTRAPQP
jgi:ABC-type multidrug transport system ATPase subunit